MYVVVFVFVVVCVAAVVVCLFVLVFFWVFWSFVVVLVFANIHRVNIRYVRNIVL